MQICNTVMKQPNAICIPLVPGFLAATCTHICRLPTYAAGTYSLQARTYTHMLACRHVHTPSLSFNHVHTIKDIQPKFLSCYLLVIL
jgi:hypothetical protein